MLFCFANSMLLALPCTGCDCGSMNIIQSSISNVKPDATRSGISMWLFQTGPFYEDPFKWWASLWKVLLNYSWSSPKVKINHNLLLNMNLLIFTKIHPWSSMSAAFLKASTYDEKAVAGANTARSGHPNSSFRRHKCITKVFAFSPKMLSCIVVHIWIYIYIYTFLCTVSYINHIQYKNIGYTSFRPQIKHQILQCPRKPAVWIQLSKFWGSSSRCWHNNWVRRFVVSVTWVIWIIIWQMPHTIQWSPENILDLYENDDFPRCFVTCGNFCLKPWWQNWRVMSKMRLSVHFVLSVIAFLLCHIR